MKIHRKYPLNRLSVLNTTTLLLLMGCAGVGRKSTEAPIEFDATPTSVDGYLDHLTYDENTAFVANQELYDVDIAEGPEDITFSLEIEDAGLASLVEIHPQTGVITFVDDFSPDYDAGDQEFEVTVVASTQRQQVRQTIKVTINDINDEAPTFSATPADSSSIINENAQYSAQFQALPDAALDGVTIRYSLSGDDARFFDIDTQTGQLSSKSDTVFDHESGKTEYSLKIIATTYQLVDGLPQPVSYDGEELVTELDISITVSDINDIAPLITSSVSGPALVENTEVATTTAVYTAEGTPDAEGDSIAWSLKDNNGDDAGLFDIDSSSGVVTFKQATTPDYENKDSYSFTIVATSGDLSSEQVVTIAVTDANDMPPVFAQGTQAAISIIDRTTTFDGVTYQAVADVASVPVTYTIEAIAGKEADIASFQIDTTTGVLTAASTAEFVHATQSSYEFNIIATAGSQTATQKVVVTVAPIEQSTFLSALPGAKGDIMFGQALGSEFLQGSELSDIIVGGSGNNTINTNNNATGGDIILGGLGDDIIALHGSNGTNANQVVYRFSSETWLAFDGADVVSNFDRGIDKLLFIDLAHLDGIMSFESFIDGLIAGGGSIGFTTDIVPLGSDAGSSYIDGLKFSFAAGYPFQGDVLTIAFTDPTSDYSELVALATTLRTLLGDDLTADSDSSATALASFKTHLANLMSDSNNNHTIDATRDITPSDIEEIAAHGPTISGARSIAVAEGRNFSETYTALQPDGSYATFRLGGADAQYFTIAPSIIGTDTDTGNTYASFEYTLRAKDDHLFNYEQKAGYEFNVIAVPSDSDLPEAVQRVVITVIDVNETPSVVVTGSQYVIYEGSYDEPADTGYVVLVSDEDGTTPVVTVSDDRFEVTSEGSLRVKTGASFDYEASANPVILLTITATDADDNTITATEEVSIVITNINDVAPSITSLSSGPALVENTEVAADTAVYSATGTYDVTAIVWSLKENNGDDAVLFDIDSSSGVVTFKQATTPDYENKDSYSFTIVATSGDLSSEQVVTVSVTDVPSTASFAADAVTSFTIEDRTTVFDAVTFSASPVGATEPIIYGLAAVAGKETDIDAFTIDSATGVLTAASNVEFHHYDKASYEIYITAKTSASAEPALHKVTVTVDDPAESTFIKVPFNTPHLGSAIYGTSGTDVIDGTEVHDFINAGSHDDVITTNNGENGGDIIIGGYGKDTITLEGARGGGIDQLMYRFDSTDWTATDGGDVVNEFNLTVDKLLFVDVAALDGVSSLNDFIDGLIAAGGSIRFTTDTVPSGEANADASYIDGIVFTFAKAGTIDGANNTASSGNSLTLNFSPTNSFTTAVQTTQSLVSVIGASLTIDSTSTPTVLATFKSQIATLTNDSANNATFDVTRDGTPSALTFNEGPVFTSGRTKLVVAENGTLTAETYAADYANNSSTGTGRLDATLSLFGADADLFDFDATTGVLTAKSTTSFDYETKSSYEVFISAVGATADIPMALMRVDIIVANQNDEAPLITSDATSAISLTENTLYEKSRVSVDENGTPILGIDNLPVKTGGATVYEATGTYDAMPIYWSLKPNNNDDSELFEIHEETGLVTVAKDFTPDHEAQDSYSFTVVATSGDHTVEKDITVSVTNVNDSPPVIISGDTASHPFAIDGESHFIAGQSDFLSYYKPMGTYDVTPITWSIKENNNDDGDLFQIFANTGFVGSNQTLSFDYETKPSYHFTIVATSGSYQTEKDITLHVTNINDNAPIITSSATPQMGEGAFGTDDAIYTATATPDLVGDTVSWSFKPNNNDDADLFEIGSNGAVTFKEATEVDFDTDAKLTYEFTLVATTGLYESEQDVTLTFVNVNEAPIYIGESAYKNTSFSPDDVHVLPSVVHGQDYYLDMNNYFRDPEGDLLTFSLAFEGVDNNLETVLNLSSDGIMTTNRHSDDSAVFVENIIITATDASGKSLSREFSMLYSTSIEFDFSPAQYTLTEGENVGNITLGSISTIETFKDTLAVDDDRFEITSDQVLRTKADADFDFETEGGEIRIILSAGLNQVDSPVPSYFTITEIITLTNDADTAPSFTGITPSQSVIAYDVAENTSFSQSFAASPDVSTDIVSYSLSGADAALFEVSSAGLVTNKSTTAFDYEGGKTSYAFTVTASTGSGNDILSSTQDVTITVTDANDVAPVITSEANISVDENTVFTTQTAIYSATATPDVVGDLVSWSFKTTDAGGNNLDDDAGLFDIDSSSGAVTFKQATTPDYESGKTSYGFTIVATSGDLASEQAVTITVTDLNEVAPVITSSASGPALVENTEVAAETAVYSATGTYDVTPIVWSFKPNNSDDAGLFNIDSSSGAVTFKQATTPDHEHKDSYSLTIVATTGGLSSEQVVTIAVTDVNEAPFITSSDSGAALIENQLVADTQILYSAEGDYDLIPIVWSIDRSKRDDGGLFTIDNDTGEVRFANATQPNYEAQDSYNFTIIATSGEVATTKIVTIAVANVNEVAPLITSDASKEISENTTFTTTQAIYTATGTYDLTAIVWSFKPNNSDDADLFDINSSSGAVTFKQATTPDYESGKTSYTFTVVATSGDLSSEKDVTISVTDVVNDVMPAFTTGASTISVKENASFSESYAATYQVEKTELVGTALVKRFVTEDALLFLGGKDAAYFQLSADGILTPKFSSASAPGTNFDYESKSSYEITITASAPPSFETANIQDFVLKIVINVENQNDVAPAITSDASGDIAENTLFTNTTAVYTAEGAPDVEGDSIAWSLKGGNSDDADLFDINSTSGAVTFKQATTPDHESGKTSYGFTIVATTGNLSSEQDVIITVTDVNDVPPVISSGENVSIDENTVFTTQTAVYRAQGTTDVASNSIVWSLKGSNNDDADLFNIDSSSGAVTFKQATTPDYESGKTSYAFTIVATTGGLSSEQVVTIAVTDVNEAPFITSSDSGAALIENQLVADTQILYSAEGDYDLIPIVWSIDRSKRDDGGLFTIDNDTGEVRFANATQPNYEAQDSYNFTIIATSGEVTTTKIVTIAVANVNEVAPLITSDASKEISENTTFTTTQAIYTATGTYDLTAIVWSLKDNNGDDAGLFDIDSSSGAVTFKQATTPDYENKDSYSFTIVATSGDLSSEQVVTIAITDANDMPPFFAQGTQAAISISDRTTTFDGVTYQAVADLASVPVTYSIEAIAGKEADIASFQIDTTTGVLTASSTAEFVRATQSSYEFNIIATAGSQTATQKVVVTVAPIEQSTFLSALPGAKGDIMFGQALGSEFLQGSELSDIIVGGSGNNTINTNNNATGGDIILGGLGDDIIALHGSNGTNANQVVYRFSSETWLAFDGADVVSNFDRGIDKLLFIDLAHLDGIMSFESFIDGLIAGGGSIGFTTDIVPLGSDAGSSYIDGLKFSFAAGYHFQGDVLTIAFTDPTSDYSELVALATTLRTLLGDDLTADSDSSATALASFKTHLANLMSDSNNNHTIDATRDITPSDIEEIAAHGPTISGARSIAVAEGRNFSETYTALQPDGSYATFRLGGADAQYFTIAPSIIGTDTDTGNTYASFEYTLRAKYDQPFNYEQKANYDINVIAVPTDSDLPEAVHRVVITVTDVNDTPSVVVTGSQYVIYEGSYDEPADTGYVVLVSDEDGTTPVVTVSDDRFEVTSEGSLRVKTGASFDYEASANPVIWLTITATDADDNTITATDEVSIVITNAHDVAPIFTSGANGLSVTEGDLVSKSTTLYTAKVKTDGSYNEIEDITGPAFSQVTVTPFVIGSDDLIYKNPISGSDEWSVFGRMISNESVIRDGFVRFTVDDTDTKMDLGIALVAQDNTISHYGLYFDAGTLYISEEGNRQAHMLTGDAASYQAGDIFAVQREGDKISYYNLSQDEVTPIHTSTITTYGRLHADFDLFSTGGVASNAIFASGALPLAYALKDGQDAALFDINSATGVVTFKDDMTAELNEKSSYQVTVLARNGGLVSEQVVTIAVQGINDEPPVITSAATAVNALAENTEVATTTAVYSATGTYDAIPIIWSLKDNNGDDAGLFDIDSSSGAVTFKQATTPDHEDKDSYSFTIVATSGDLSSEQVVTIAVTDVNDAPVITSSDSGAALTENQLVADTQILYRAEGDYDLIPIEWSIDLSKQDDGGLFTIDTGTGEVRFANATQPNYEAQDSYNFTIKATSGEVTATKTVTIAVINVNEVAPVITSGDTASSSFAIDGQSHFVPYYQPMGTYDATPITWSIKENNNDDGDLFQMYNTGFVGSKRVLSFDHETKPSYHFTIVATSGDHTAEKDITLHVTDVNDMPPVFTSSSTGTIIDDDNEIAATTTLYTASATPDVAGDTVIWSLKDNGANDDASLFEIDANGDVTFKTATTPDHEGKNSYSFTIIATVNASNASAGQNTSAELTVILSVEVDDTLVISSDASVSSLAHGKAVDGDFVVYDGEATSDSAAAITWSFKNNGTSDDRNLFDINIATGEVSFVATSTTPNYGSKNQYEFTITAKQGSTTVEQDITVKVNAINLPTATRSGTEGFDTMDGTSVSETVQGGDNNDVISTGGGGDTVIGGYGNDTITLGDGADTVVIRFDSNFDGQGSYQLVDGSDEINNFEFGVDRLVLVDVNATNPITSFSDFEPAEDGIVLVLPTYTTGNTAIKDTLVTGVSIQFTTGSDSTSNGDGSPNSALTIKFDVSDTSNFVDTADTTQTFWKEDAQNQIFYLDNYDYFDDVLGGENAVAVIDDDDLPTGLTIL